jgi:GntR family transcriptional regulator/MocR family aminotransferase
MFLRLDRKRALYGQVYRALRAQILDGALGPGTQVTSTRSLSAELGISRTIVVLAYEQLVGEGYIAARTGAGTFVASELPDSLTTASRSSPKLLLSGSLTPRNRL